MSGNYRILHGTFWMDRKLRAMEVDVRLIYLYLITSPHAHMSGVYYVPMVTIAHDLAITEDRVRYGIDTLSGDWITYYPDDEVVFVKKMAKYQVSGPKCWQNVACHLNNLGKIKACTDFKRIYKLRVSDRVSDRVSSNMPTEQDQDQDQDQDQEQEQDQDQESIKSTFPSPSLSASPPEQEKATPHPERIPLSPDMEAMRAGVGFNLSRAPAILSSDKRPMGDERDQVIALVGHHAELWGEEVPLDLPEDDTMQRCLQAIRKFGLDDCKRAIAGHKKLTSREGNVIGKGFRSCFPEGRTNGNRHSHKLDPDRFREFIQEAPKEAGNGNGKYGAMGRYWSKEEIRAIRAKSEEQLNQAERYVRANCPEKYWS
jgi:hypothetical protein